MNQADCTVGHRQFFTGRGGMTDAKQHGSGENHKRNERHYRKNTFSFKIRLFSQICFAFIQKEYKNTILPR